ncbi:MAG: ribosomal protein S18 acetylase RimI-like enzyme [Thermoproteota archaeon]
MEKLIELHLKKNIPMQLEVRKAEISDCKFLAQIVLNSESTGFEIVTFQKMFELEREEMLETLTSVISNDTGGHPLSFKSYYIALKDGVKCGAFSSYIEGVHGDSNLLMANALISKMDRALVMKGFSYSKQHSEIIIPKTIGFRQIDCVATLEEYRGMGVFRAIYDFAYNDFNSQVSSGSEIQVWKNNPAVLVYEKFGYSIQEEYPSKSDSNKTKLLMRKLTNEN